MLLRGDSIADIQSATDARLGSNGPLELVDRGEVPVAAARFYRVLQVPLDAPLDLDRDGMDDV